ncbi:hypothetical protein [Alteribacillus bidgolensis]|uniref:Uncharacterized protein n=1 Tax=Alteribacillus bidgolensis TaxID=930129 RepID=A0A1G8JJ80_9BACI|nr:hypothetical protein [Alteribacillus bidgolensis]SDI31123.1 hypothetical protein SAMN05216352_106214 [Alteribacillus bidgolensis]
MQRTRLSIYRIEELIDYINEKGYHKIEGYNNLNRKTEALIAEYSELERKYINFEESELKRERLYLIISLYKFNNYRI